MPGGKSDNDTICTEYGKWGWIVYDWIELNQV